MTFVPETKLIKYEPIYCVLSRRITLLRIGYRLILPEDLVIRSCFCTAMIKLLAMFLYEIDLRYPLSV